MWAIKYRPKTLDEVLGQEWPKKVIRGALKRQSLSHGWLLTGPFGSGKTTFVRIIAKALACHNPTSEGEACQQCHSCQSIDAESSNNYNEIDAASFGSADAIRELVQEAQIAPIGGSQNRVIALDEAHVMSKVAQAVLLKTLEDPPEHTHFILLTTDPQKLLETIKSRCIPVELQPVEKREVQRHLAYICEREKVEFENGALELVVQHKYGHVRDALTLAETISLAGPLSLDNVKHHLHLDLDEKVYKILKRDKSWEEVFDYIEDMSRDYAPELIWESVKRSILQAHLFRLAPSRVVRSDGMKHLSDTYGGKLEVVSEWCLGRGPNIKVRNNSDLVVALALLQEQLGSRVEVKEQSRGVQMGVSKSKRVQGTAVDVSLDPEDFARRLGFHLDEGNTSG